MFVVRAQPNIRVKAQRVFTRVLCFYMLSVSPNCCLHFAVEYIYKTDIPAK